MSRKVTLKQVAAAANLAVPTVSQILNGRRNFCSEEQCKRVRAIARELGYVPNLGYRIMTGQETNTVAVMVSTVFAMQDDHNRDLVINLLDGFSCKGCGTLFGIFEKDVQNNIAKVREFLSRGATRFVFIGCPVGGDEIFALLKREKIPFLSDNRSTDRWVLCDSSSGRAVILRKMAEFTGGNFRMFWTGGVDGFPQKILDLLDDPDYWRQRISAVPDLVKDYQHEAFVNGYEVLKQALAENPQLRGSAFPNDMYALGAAQLLFERGITGFMISGCNGDRATVRFPYPVTTLKFDLKQMAEVMVERVFDDEPCRIAVPVEIISEPAMI